MVYCNNTLRNALRLLKRQHIRFPNLKVIEINAVVLKSIGFNDVIARKR